MIHDLCVVVIGRNEGERLHRCLEMVCRQTARIVYVDSGSSDGSADYAATLGVTVVRLDLSTPFSAGRARNEGVAQGLRVWPDSEFVQFVDGDCEVAGEWLSVARATLGANSSWAIVAGRVKERYPEKSVYNLLCDLEWDTPVGEVEACGGIFLVRLAAFREVAGFNPAIIAGEEPELCYRLRKQGWHIHRLEQPMAFHDAAILHFRQWWRRSVRSGHAYAQGYALHGAWSGGYCLRDSLRIWLWALFLPGLILCLACVVDPRFTLLAMVYPLQLGRVAMVHNTQVNNWRQSSLYALFNLVGKFPQLIGQLLFVQRQLSGKKYVIIEYD